MPHPIIFLLLPALVTAGPGLNPNPNPKFDPATSRGTFGPFTIPRAAAISATSGPPPGSLDARTVQAMQLAMSNWATDTGIVSLFQNNGGSTSNNQQFKGIADGAFKAEVDELTQKGVLDQVIGNDPRVSLANLTLTNGVFQSVVDNLQIMSIQGTKRANLIDTINQVRCTQILPSIDTYMLVAAEYIGDNAQQRRAVRPNACVAILAAANSSSFATLPGTPAGSPAGAGDGIINGVPNACGQGSGISILGFGNSTAPGVANQAIPSASSPTLSLGDTTTPQLGLPGFPSGATSAPAAAASATSSSGSGSNNSNAPGSSGATTNHKSGKSSDNSNTSGADGSYTGGSLSGFGSLFPQLGIHRGSSSASGTQYGSGASGSNSGSSSPGSESGSIPAESDLGSDSSASNAGSSSSPGSDDGSSSSGSQSSSSSTASELPYASSASPADTLTSNLSHDSGSLNSTVLGGSNATLSQNHTAPTRKRSAARLPRRASFNWRGNVLK